MSLIDFLHRADRSGKLEGGIAMLFTTVVASTAFPPAYRKWDPPGEVAIPLIIALALLGVGFHQLVRRPLLRILTPPQLTAVGGMCWLLTIPTVYFSIILWM